MQHLFYGVAHSKLRLRIFKPVLYQHLRLFFPQAMQQSFRRQLHFLLFRPGHLFLFEQVEQLQLIPRQSG